MPTVTLTVTLTGPDAHESADRLVQAISEVEHGPELKAATPVLIDIASRRVLIGGRPVRFTRREFGPEEILERCLLALVNEGAKILDEGIADSARDVDLVYLNGYGFPADKGGPLAWADTLGVEEVLKRLNYLTETRGAHWQPSALIQRLATEGRRFADVKKEG